MATRVGPVALPNPVMTASGTSGHGTELADYGALGDLGAVVVKSLSVGPVAGQPGATGARGRTRDAQQRRAAGTWAGRMDPGRPAGAGPIRRPRRGEHLGSLGGGLPARCGCRGDGGRLGGWVLHRGARGERELPQRGGPLPHVRPLGGGNRPGTGGHGVRPAPLGQAQPQRARHRRDRHRGGARAAPMA